MIARRKAENACFCPVPRKAWYKMFRISADVLLATLEC